jgi:hypothetical protein
MRRPKPSPKAVEVALDVIAEELMRLHPDWGVCVVRPGQPPPAGAVTLLVLSEDDVEAVLDRPARDRRQDDEPVDE